MTNGPSKLSHMERAESSSSSSSEASDRHPRQRQHGGRRMSRIQSASSTGRMEKSDTAGKGGQRLSSNIASVGEYGSSAELIHEAGNEAKSAARPGESVQDSRDTDAGGDDQGLAEGGMQRIGQGRQLSTSNRFIDSDGNIDVDAIQDDDIRDLGSEPVQPSSSAGSHLPPGHGQSGSIKGSAASTRRRREDDEDQHDLKEMKRPRVEGS